MFEEIKKLFVECANVDEEEVKPEIQQLEEFMKLLTEDQINLIYEHFGARKTLKQICDEENAANGTDKSPQSVGNRKKKILDRLKKLFEKLQIGSLRQ